MDSVFLTNETQLGCVSFISWDFRSIIDLYFSFTIFEYGLRHLKIYHEKSGK